MFDGNFSVNIYRFFQKQYLQFADVKKGNMKNIADKGSSRKDVLDLLSGVQGSSLLLSFYYLYYFI